MKKLLVIAVLTCAVATLARGQTGDQKSAGGVAGSISGIYSLYRLETPDKGSVGRMVMIAQKGDSFLIWGIGWGGEGKIEREQGYYDWKFDDGRTGRTTFVINSDGTLKGHVLGSGLDWWYLARRSQAESADTTARDSETQKKIDEMIKNLRDKDNLAREVSIIYLVRMRAREIIPDLIQLLQDKDGMVRREAAIGLGKLGAIEVLPELRKLLMDEDGSVRAGAATAIGILGYKNEATIYLKKLLSHTSPEIRGDAALGLGELGIKETIPDIINLLKERDVSLLLSVMIAVKQLDAREAIPELLKILKETMVKKESPDAGPRLDAALLLPSLVITLNYFGAKEAAPDFIKLLKDDRMRATVVRALGQFGAKEATPDLIQALSDKENSVRINTVYALGKLGAKDSIPELVKLLKDPSGNIRGLTAIVLVEFGAKDKVSQEIIKDIEPILKWGGEYKTRASFALKELGVTK